MNEAVLDTSVLLHWWNRRRSRHRGPVTADHAQAWGRELATIERTTVIVTPVLLEVVGGTTSAAELRLMRAFLEPFECVDEQRITAHDWEEARRLARTDRVLVAAADEGIELAGSLRALAAPRQKRTRRR